MQRSLETAHIYAKNIAVGGQYKTRPRSILSYETLKLPMPYDHAQIYDSFIEEYLKKNYSDKDIKSFESLSGEEKEQAASYADGKTLVHFMNLDTEEARQARKEVAGSFAVLIEHFSKMAKEKLKSNQKILYPVGSHTGMMEPLLSESLVRINKDGNKVIGGTLDDFGGSFNPSEGFDVRIKTNEAGELEQYVVSFDNNQRFSGEIYLDANKIKELAEFYRNLHHEND